MAQNTTDAGDWARYLLMILSFLLALAGFVLMIYGAVQTYEIDAATARRDNTTNFLRNFLECDGRAEAEMAGVTGPTQAGQQPVTPAPTTPVIPGTPGGAGGQGGGAAGGGGFTPAQGGGGGFTPAQGGGGGFAPTQGGAGGAGGGFFRQFQAVGPVQPVGPAQPAQPGQAGAETGQGAGAGQGAGLGRHNVTRGVHSQLNEVCSRQQAPYLYLHIVSAIMFLLATLLGLIAVFSGSRSALYLFAIAAATALPLLIVSAYVMAAEMARSPVSNMINCDKLNAQEIARITDIGYQCYSVNGTAKDSVKKLYHNMKLFWVGTGLNFLSLLLMTSAAAWAYAVSKVVVLVQATPGLTEPGPTTAHPAPVRGGPTVTEARYT